MRLHIRHVSTHFGGICVCVCTCVQCVYVCRCIGVCVYVRMYVRRCVHISIGVYVCVYMRVWGHGLLSLLAMALPIGYREWAPSGCVWRWGMWLHAVPFRPATAPFTGLANCM